MAEIRQFLRFCVVGGIGFVVDVAVLELLVAHTVSVLLARLVSIFVALQVTYTLHGMFTFRRHQGYSVARWVSFMGLNLLGAAINYLIFLGVFRLGLFGTPFLDREAGLIAGTAVALFCNYWMNRRFVFTQKGPTP